MEFLSLHALQFHNLAAALDLGLLPTLCYSVLGVSGSDNYIFEASSVAFPYVLSHETKIFYAKQIFLVVRLFT